MYPLAIKMDVHVFCFASGHATMSLLPCLADTGNKAGKMISRVKKNFQWQAAQWRVDGDLAAAVGALERVLALEGGNAKAWFALGQTLTAMKQWRLAENAYTEAAHRESDAFMQSRAWLGAGAESLSYHNMQIACGDCLDWIVRGTSRMRKH